MSGNGKLILSAKGAGWARFALHGALAAGTLALGAVFTYVIATDMGNDGPGGVEWPLWVRLGCAAFMMAAFLFAVWFAVFTLGRNVITVRREGDELVVTELPIFGPRRRRIALADITDSKYVRARTSKRYNMDHLVLEVSGGAPVEIDLDDTDYDADAWHEIAPRAMSAWKRKSPDKYVTWPWGREQSRRHRG